jgi:hypothetical protein
MVAILHQLLFESNRFSNFGRIKFIEMANLFEILDDRLRPDPSNYKSDLMFDLVWKK